MYPRSDHCCARHSFAISAAYAQYSFSGKVHRLSEGEGGPFSGRDKEKTRDERRDMKTITAICCRRLYSSSPRTTIGLGVCLCVRTVTLES